MPIPMLGAYPPHVQGEFYDYLPCGMLAHGFRRLGGARLVLLQHQGPTYHLETVARTR